VAVENNFFRWFLAADEYKPYFRRLFEAAENKGRQKPSTTIFGGLGEREIGLTIFHN
jgi:hypothetical protein